MIQVIAEKGNIAQVNWEGSNMVQAKTTYRYKNDIFVSWEKKTVPFHIAEFSAHNAYEIYVLLEGERRVYIGDKVYDTCAGNAIMLAANVPHRSEGATPYRGICIQFTGRQLDRYYTTQAKKQLLSCFGREVIPLDRNTLAELQLLLCDMLAEPERKVFYLPAVLALFHRGPDSVTEHAAEGEAGAAADEAEKSKNARDVRTVSVQTIESFIQENVGRIESLQQIAEHFGITKGYLCALFKKRTGITVIAYLNNIRIQEACRLLTVTEDSVEQISVRCGFQSTVYFHRLFKKMMNYTPAKYRVVIRQSHREENRTSELVP